MSSKGRKVINAANIPCAWPVVPTLVLYLFLDRVDASGVVWGIIGTFVVLAWVLVAIDVFTREQLPPLDGEDADRLSRLKQRLDLQVRRLDLMHEWLTIHMSRLDDIYRRLGMEFKD